MNKSKIKKELRMKLPYIKNHITFNENYFSALSWCTANLGVVPLFLFATFLLLPILESFLLLLFFVTRVFETILSLPYYIYLKSRLNFENAFLHLSAHFVKVISTLAILYLSTGAIASNFSTLKESTLVLAIGEYHEIPGDFTHILRVNKDIIKAKLLPSQKKIRLRGLMKGFSELIIWNQQGIKRKINIYVFSKKKYLDTLANIEVLSNMGLNTEIKGPYIKVKGTLKALEDYKLLQKIIKKNKERIHLDIKLSKTLRNKIIGEVYYLFFKQHIDQVRCEVNEGIHIYCYYPNSISPSKDSINFLRDNYSVDFLTINNKKTAQNFKLKMKIISLEKIDGEELGLGLDSLQGNLIDIFNKGLMGMIQKNNLVLKSHNIELSTIAEPQSIIQIDKEAYLQVGSEIPYQSGRKNSSSSETIWKFAGLKIQITLRKEGDKLKVDYQTEFTRPDVNSSVSGSKEKSSATIELGTPIEIFQIGFKTYGKKNTGLPFLSKIPFLGNLFKSKSDQQTYKKISGIIYITEG